jgi:hypothetical protein
VPGYIRVAPSNTTDAMTDTSFSGQVRARRSEDEGASRVARLA